MSNQNICVCGKIFTFKQSFYRHRKTCSKMTALFNNNIREITRLNEVISSLKHDLELKTHENLFLKERIDDSKEKDRMITNAGNIVNKTVGIIDFMVKHFSKTPALEEINDFSIIKKADGNEDYNVADIVICHFRNNTLHKFLGLIIVAVYKKDDPQLQSIWSTDVERMSYLVRDIIKTDDDEDAIEWIVDKKGIRVREKAILPMLRFIRSELRKYIKTAKKNVNSNTIKNMQLATDIIALIGNTSKKGVSELAHRINKFIANHFFLDKYKVLKLLE